MFLSLTMSKFLFDGKSHLKELAISEVTDFQLNISSITNIIQRFSSLFKNTCLQELNNLQKLKPGICPKLMETLDTSLPFQKNSKN